MACPIKSRGLLALDLKFSDTVPMKDVSEWQVPKWPFLTANAVLILIAGALVYKIEHPITLSDTYIPVGCVVLGALLGCLPFILEYRATCKLVELNALSSVAEQLADLKNYTEQIKTATDQWASVQQATKGNTDKTVAAAKDVADRMTEEIRDFNEFQQKLNDTEKAALKLEIEKLRRAEGEWLQVLARILDHIFALHNAALRSGNGELAEQIGGFQNACRDTARRMGLSAFSLAPQEKFDPQRCRAHGIESPPADAVVAETLAPGMTYQGRLIRPALVRLHDANAPVDAAPAAEPAAEISPAKPEPADAGQLELEAD